MHPFWEMPLKKVRMPFFPFGCPECVFSDWTLLKPCSAPLSWAGSPISQLLGVLAANGSQMSPSPVTCPHSVFFWEVKSQFQSLYFGLWDGSYVLRTAEQQSRRKSFASWDCLWNFYVRSALEIHGRLGIMITACWFHLLLWERKKNSMLVPVSTGSILAEDFPEACHLRDDLSRQKFDRLTRHS